MTDKQFQELCEKISSFLDSFNFRDIIIFGLICSIIIISCNSDGKVVEQKNYKEELAECMIVVNQCNVQSKTVNAQIKQILSATKEQICK